MMAKLFQVGIGRHNWNQQRPFLVSADKTVLRRDDPCI